jgi:hypothetical protein
MTTRGDDHAGRWPHAAMTTLDQATTPRGDPERSGGERYSGMASSAD